jgi:integrase
LTPNDAAEALRDLLAAAPKGPRRRGPTPTFQEACEEWLRYVEHEKQRTPSTLRDYRQTVRNCLIPHFGEGTPITAITTRKIDAFRERLLEEGRLSRRSVQKALVLLHGILKRAKRKGWISSNPAEDAERVSIRRSGDFRALSVDEVLAVTRAATNQQDAAIFFAAAFTGLRMGELRALRWRDVEFAKELVHVRRSLPGNGDEKEPKSGAVRSVPLVAEAAVALDGLSRREHFTAPDDYVFVNDVGRPVDDSKLRKAFAAAVSAAGVTPLRFHDLRHTFGTLAVQAFPLSDVQAYMGHSDIATTMIYVHHMPRHDAAERLTRVLRADSMPSVDGKRSALS